MTFLWWFYSNPDRTSLDDNRHYDRVFLTPGHDILNGKHRIAIAAWHRVPEIPCIIDDRYTEFRQRTYIYRYREEDN